MTAQALPPIERAGYLYKIADGLKAERDHFAKLLVEEQGKTLNEALGEVDDRTRTAVQGDVDACLLVVHADVVMGTVVIES